MMRRYRHALLWVIGFIVLLILIQYPFGRVIPNWKAIPQPLAGQTIVIDPGHGGPDGGAIGKEEITEKEITLAIAKKTRDYAQQAGAVVYLTREKDEDLADHDTKGLSNRKSEDIRNRMAFIEEHDPDFFITIHLNAIPDGRWSGAQTFYYPEVSANENLAEMIQESIKENLENTKRTPLAIDNIYLLKHTEVPGALVEAGFLSNQEEEQLLIDESYQDQMAASIYQGMIRYTVDEDGLESFEQ